MKVLIAGDYCEKYRVSECISKGNYATMFEEVKPIINKADISIVNFEFPIVKNDEDPIMKCGPNLKGQQKAVEAIKYAGFNVCTLANNHILDQGEHSCLNTKLLIDKAGLHTVGIGKNLHEARAILYLKSEDKTLAIINCCEHEFSVATANTAGANPLNPIQQYYQIRKAHKNADFVLVIVHGGHEHFQLPSLRMKETYRFFVDSGADAVVNHHQHCYSGFETYKGKPIFYGLGNFLFDHKIKRHEIWNEGYMVCLEFKKDVISYDIIPYTQCNDIPQIKLLSEEEKRIFNQKIKVLCDTINNDLQLQNAFNAWVERSQHSLLSLFEPYSSRIMLALYNRHLLPSFITQKRLLKLKNYVYCESHIDVLKLIIDKSI